MNCFIKSFLWAPINFLTPTSFALFEARAVERFIKLIQAITWIRTAINIKIYRNDGPIVFINSGSYPRCSMY